MKTKTKIEIEDYCIPAPAEFTVRELEREPILRMFRYAHLPEGARLVSAPFCILAMTVIERCREGPKRTAALRRLLEARDAALRIAR